MNLLIFTLDHLDIEIDDFISHKKVAMQLKSLVDFQSAKSCDATKIPKGFIWLPKTDYVQKSWLQAFFYLLFFHFHLFAMPA